MDNLLQDPADLAVEIVRQEGGQFERMKLLIAMINNLSSDGTYRLAQEGIQRAIESKRLRCQGKNGDTLAIT